MIGGSQNLMASGVWCIIRMCLEVRHIVSLSFTHLRSTYISPSQLSSTLAYFDKISTMFMTLGTSWGLHKDFARLFPNSRDFQAFLLGYIISVVAICKKSVLFLKKSSFKQFTSSLLASFDGEFGPSVAELRQWGKLVEQQAAVLATEFARQAEDRAVVRNTSLLRHISTTARTHHMFEQRHRLLASLATNQGVYETRWRRQCRKGTSRWLFGTTCYRNWGK